MENKVLIITIKLWQQTEKSPLEVGPTTLRLFLLTYSTVSNPGLLFLQVFVSGFSGFTVSISSEKKSIFLLWPSALTYDLDPQNVTYI